MPASQDTVRGPCRVLLWEGGRRLLRTQLLVGHRGASVRRNGGRRAVIVQRRIFVSYLYGHDNAYKQRLVSWLKGPRCEFSFYDNRVDISVESAAAATIKDEIATRIGDATHLLCLIGRDTHKDGWINWEISKAVELEKRIIAVRIDRDSATPPALKAVNAAWASSFDLAAIRQAVDQS